MQRYSDRDGAVDQRSHSLLGMQIMETAPVKRTCKNPYHGHRFFIHIKFLWIFGPKQEWPQFNGGVRRFSLDVVGTAETLDMTEITYKEALERFGHGV